MPRIDFINNLIDLIIEYYALKYEQQKYSDKVIIHFLQGNCGILALVLKDIFPEGDIFIDSYLEHLVFGLNNYYYDACGLIINQTNFSLATESDFLRLIPYYGTKNFEKTKQIINDLVQIGLAYKHNQDWEKTQIYLKKRALSNIQDNIV